MKIQKVMAKKAKANLRELAPEVRGMQDKESCNLAFASLYISVLGLCGPAIYSSTFFNRSVKCCSIHETMTIYFKMALNRNLEADFR